MGLRTYKAKRDFEKSPEPTGGKPGEEKLRFVIQKHDASHLHYDFRLELDGVLKSWAVPKGPSTDPTVKRLAMMVEDHPFDYRNFEGIIPSGYGAGTVIIWDEGFYEPVEAEGGKKEQERYLRRGLHAGKLHFILKGKKLKGEYALVKAHGRGENGWLLMKIRDKFVSSDDVTLKDKSVISKKTLAQIGKTSTNIYGESQKSSSAKKVAPVKKKSAGKKKAAKKGSSKKKAAERDQTIPVISAPKRKFPAGLRPMLARLVDKPFEKEGWIYEVKWDGYRALALCHKGKVALKSRNDKSFNDKFYPVTEAFKVWGADVVMDGEIIVANDSGLSDFGALQNWRSEADGDLYFYAFDLLWYDGKDLTGLPLSERKEILKAILPENETIRYSESFTGSGLEFFAAAAKMGLEGIIAKKGDSHYYPGARSDEWLKIKAMLRQEMVIGGYTINDDSSKPFSSVLVGVYEGDNLIYRGKVGTGFNVATQKQMLARFKKLETKKVPFTETPDVNKPSRFRPDPPHATVTWLKPRLVCEVSYTEMTSDGIMRHPSFEGMRVDKDPKDVVQEIPNTVKETVGKAAPMKKMLRPGEGKSKHPKTLLNPKEETQVKKVNGHEMKFTNLGKIFWPGENVTKRDVINYYYQVAPYILPYLVNRPQSMNRHPNGIAGKHFYYKDVTGKAPDWIETFLYHSEADHRDRNYLVAKDTASLLYMASLGCIEMNPWHSTVEKEDYPDWCIIDLDPAENTFEQVIEAARVTKEILDSLDVPSYPKTSGSTGMHIYIPFGAKYTYEQSKEFARVIARLVHEQLPKFTSIERMVKNRKGKMYIDFLQNRPQATVSAPYSLRPKPGATVSMPLHWDEVKRGLKMKDFNIHNTLDRLKSEGDLFKPVLGKGIDLNKVIKKFTS